jgi:hypothetical protein
VEVACVSSVVTAGAQAWYGNRGHERTTRAWLAASPRFAWLVAEHLPQFRLICLRFFEANLS